MKKCEKTASVTILGINEKARIAMLFNPRCGSWQCDYCAEQKKENWIHQATRGTQIITGEGRDVQFVTLTSRGYATPNKSIYFFKQNFPKLRKRLADGTNQWRRNLGLEWAYFLVPERHKSGVLHCHMLAATHYNTEGSWKDFAFQTGFGWKVDVKPVVTAKQASEYIAKYLHKGVGSEEWPKGFMRVRHSQNWPISRPKKDKNWEWVSYKNEETLWIEKHSLIDMGWKVIDKTK